MENDVNDRLTGNIEIIADIDWYRYFRTSADRKIMNSFTRDDVEVTLSMKCGIFFLRDFFYHENR